MYRSQSRWRQVSVTTRVSRARMWTLGQQEEVIFVWQFVLVRTLICHGETLKVLRWSKLIGAFKNKLQTLSDFMNSYTVEWIHNDRCILRVWWELYLQCERELKRCILVADLFFLNSTVQLFNFYLATLLLRHFTIPSSRPFVILYRPVFVSTSIVSTPCASVHHHLNQSP